MRSALVAAVLAVAVLPVAQAAPEEVRISGFAVNLPGSELDDAITLHNPTDERVALSRFALSDNQGRIAFPPGATLDPRSSVRIALNGTAYREAARADADYALSGLPFDRTLRVGRAGFALSQEGDRIVLDLDGAEIDVVQYGTIEATHPLWKGDPVSIRGGTFLRWFPRLSDVDHDDASDFSQPRREFLGQDRSPPLSVSKVGPIVAFTAPDHSRRVIEQLVDTTQSSLRINMYEFRDLALAQRMAERLRAQPDLALHVLLDEAPVGQSAADRSQAAHVIQTLEAAGATVRLLGHDRYAFNHAKYMIQDGETILVQSENLVPSGVPQDGRSGNRGWGVVVRDPRLADALIQRFEEDFALDPYGARAPGGAAEPRLLPPVLAPPTRPSPLRGLAPAASGANVTLLVAPSGPLSLHDPILAAIRAANHSIHVQHLNLPPAWRDAGGRAWSNPYLEALLEAATRGVKVRVLLDGHFGGSDPDQNNRATVDLLNAFQDTYDLDARLVSAGRPVQHVKGLIVDDRWTLVGSMNWNLNSVLQNREVGLVIEHAAVAAYFRDAFEADWHEAGPSHDGTPSISTLATMITLGLLGALQPGRRSRS